jgi:hypothetical protein
VSDDIWSRAVPADANLKNCGNGHLIPREFESCPSCEFVFGACALLRVLDEADPEQLQLLGDSCSDPAEAGNTTLPMRSRGDGDDV